MKLRQTLIVFACALITACATFGVPKPQGFNDSVGLSLSAATTAADLISDLVVARKIDSKDAQNALDQVKLFRDGIDVAEAVHAVDAEAGELRIQQVLVGLRSLITYLQKQGGS